MAGKTAIVTGGSRGIGAAIARRLAQDGVQVAVNYSRSPDAAEHVVGEIQAQGGIAFAVHANMAEPAQIQQLFARTQEQFGSLDILVCNAAVAAYGSLDKLTLEDYERTFAVNVRGVLICLQEAAQRMNDGGRIIAISSGAALACPPNMGIYNASKAAIEAFTKTFAVELGSRQITVNAVAPGTTETEMLREAIPDNVLPQLIANTPMGRLGTPEDIADVVAFLASDEARWVTGQVIAASGGLK
jgi:3-oxoacyl-[acyl-carrier protein] reductase